MKLDTFTSLFLLSPFLWAEQTIADDTTNAGTVLFQACPGHPCDETQERILLEFGKCVQNPNLCPPHDLVGYVRADGTTDDVTVAFFLDDACTSPQSLHFGEGNSTATAQVSGSCNDECWSVDTANYVGAAECEAGDSSASKSTACFAGLFLLVVATADMVG